MNEQNYVNESSTGQPQYPSYNGYQSAPQFGPTRNQFPPFTNITLVDSLEQALRMPARVHSEMTYWNRYKDEIYRIYTDYNNGKQYMVLDVKIQPKAAPQASATNTELSCIVDKLNKIESNLEVLNEKYNIYAHDRKANESTAEQSVQSATE